MSSFAILTDVTKYIGCEECVTACKNENEIPYDAPVTRTWVERYIVTKDDLVIMASEVGVLPVEPEIWNISVKYLHRVGPMPDWLPAFSTTGRSRSMN